jgi:hypothetical protein
MIWTAVAATLHPRTAPTATMSRAEVEAAVQELFRASITPVMVEKHLVSSEDRQANTSDPRRGGSRNRYLFRTSDRSVPSRDGRYRLCKSTDSKYDAWEKTGKMNPEPHALDSKYRWLVEWYESEYRNAAR